MKPVIALLDMDGVLVEPGGYRRAVNSVIQYIFGQMGLEYLAPGEDIPPLFESYGVTSEWDMVPLTIAIALDAVARQAGKNVFLSSFSQTAEWAASLQPRRFPVDYTSAIHSMGDIYFKKSIPSESVLDACLNGANHCPLPAISRDPILLELLQNTRLVRRSLTTRIFQSYTLGAEIFEETYGFAPPVKVKSYLETYDRPLVSTKNAAIFSSLQETGAIFPAAYTARPSMQPKEISQTLSEYSPEAEIGLRLAGLEALPMIGYGRLYYIAERAGISADDLIKPAPFQGLAGICAAWSRAEWQSLLWALNLTMPDAAVQFQDEFQPFSTPLPVEFELHVFEDSPAGINAVKNAANVLTLLGHSIDLHCWGITQNTDKIKALKKAGATIFPEINSALENLFRRIAQ